MERNKFTCIECDKIITDRRCKYTWNLNHPLSSMLEEHIKHSDGRRVCEECDYHYDEITLFKYNDVWRLCGGVLGILDKDWERERDKYFVLYPE